MLLSQCIFRCALRPFQERQTQQVRHSQAEEGSQASVLLRLGAVAEEITLKKRGTFNIKCHVFLYLRLKRYKFADNKSRKAYPLC